METKNDTHWERISALFCAALAQPREQQFNWVRSHCDGNTAIENEVNAMLEDHYRADDLNFLGETLSASGIPSAILKSVEELISASEPEQTLPDLEDYEILEKIGQGGMGIVYRARQKSLNRTVALKMLLPGVLASPETIERFQVEAEAAARLDHPAIVPVYDIGRDTSQLYYAMRYVPSESLADRMRSVDGPIGWREVSSIMRQVADAMHCAHHGGIIHRDLTPKNILLDDKGDAHIVDFGLAKEYDADSSLTLTGQIFGTPSYMPPEQAQGNATKTGPAADIYGMGATMYALLCGRPPFAAANIAETIRQVIHESPVSPKLLNSAIPRDLETICLKCLQKDPSRRYRSAAELAEDLDNCLANRPINARPVSSTERFVRWCERNRAVAALSAALVVALVLTVLGLGISNRRLRLAHETDAASMRRTLTAVNDLFNDVSENTLLREPGMQPLREQLLARAASYYDELLKDHANDPNLQREISLAYFRVGRLKSILDSPSESLEPLTRAESRIAGLVATNQEDLELLAAWGSTWNELGKTQAVSGQLRQAATSFCACVGNS